MTTEIWKIVPSTPHFLASSLGRIMVAPYFAEMPHGGVRRYGGHPHYGVWSKEARRFITVHKGKTYRIAPLVCEAFHGEKTDQNHVCMHLDEDSTNNRPENLAWGTQKENLNAPKYASRIRKRPLVASCKCCRDDFEPKYAAQIFCSCKCAGYYNNKSRAGLTAEFR